MSRDLRDVLDRTVDGPTRPLDLEVVARTARRRTVRTRSTLTGGVLAVLVAAALVVPGAIGGPGPSPDIADQPPVPEVEIPDGWVTVTAGELAISIPPDWEIETPEIVGPGADDPDVVIGGPCLGDLYRRGDPPAPTAVVYDGPTSGACSLIGYAGSPPVPGIVLYETILGTVDGDQDRTGAELVDIDERGGVRDRVGAVEVWRTGDGERTPVAADEMPVTDLESKGVVSLVGAELVGGLLVAHVDDPQVQAALATLRPATGAVPRERPIPTWYRDLDDTDWEPLAVRATPEYLGGGRVAHDQATLDDLWMRLRFDDEGPRLPSGTAAVAGATYAGGVPGGCHQLRDVIGVRVDGNWAQIVLGPLAEGWADDECSEDPFVHLVAVPSELAARFDGVDAVVLDENGEYVDTDVSIEEVEGRD